MNIQKTQNLSLKNSGRLSLLFLGVGSAFSKADYQTNLLVIKGQDHLLVDCGTRTPGSFVKMGLPVMNVDNLYVTHSHADHVGGLEEFILTKRYVKQSKVNIFINKPYEKILWEHSLMGGVAYNERKNGKYLKFSDVFNVSRPALISKKDRHMEEFNVGSINIKTFRTMHIPDSAKSWKDSALSTGMVIDDRVAFTADTRYDTDLIDMLEKRFSPEMIFHDCSFSPVPVHPFIDELNGLPSDIKAKTVLVHYENNDANDKKNEKKAAGYGFHSLGKKHHYYEF